MKQSGTEFSQKKKEKKEENFMFNIFIGFRYFIKADHKMSFIFFWQKTMNSFPTIYKIFRLKIHPLPSLPSLPKFCSRLCLQKLIKTRKKLVKKPF